MIFNRILVIKYVFFVIISFMLLSMMINWIVDANHIFHQVKIKGFNDFKYKRVQNKVLLNATKNINKFDTIIFGTSRSAIYGSSNFKNLKILNLSDAVYGYPEEIYRYIKFLETKPNNIKNIFIGIDIQTMIEQKNKTGILRNKMFYKYPTMAYLLTKYVKLLPNALPLSYLTVKNNINNKIPRTTGDENGTKHYNIATMQYNTTKTTRTVFIYETMVLKYLSKIEYLCNQLNIRVVFFTFPYSNKFYTFDYSKKDIDKRNTLLLSYVSGYYNFSYLNNLTRNDNNYFDISHQNHNFDKYLYNALVLKSNSETINGEFIYKYEH